MNKITFTNKCIYDIHDGLCDGLSHFSPPSRSALIYAVAPDDPVRVYDPQHLLQGHETKFREIYCESQQWCKASDAIPEMRALGHIHRKTRLDLAGLISFGAQSASMFHQIWFTEHHPNMCAIGPTERWLEHAAWRISHDLANKDELYTGISGHFLREYATHAVRDFLVDEMNIRLGWDFQIRVYPILDSILGISRTREEGAWPRGELVFVEPAHLGDIDFVARFPVMEQPYLENLKHVRKLLLTVEDSPRRLVSDGKSIIGIAADGFTGFCLRADFRGGHGFLKLNQNVVCSFSDGRFHSSTHRAKLVEVEEALIESRLDGEAASALYRTISVIVHSAEQLKHGCTIVVDLNDSPVAISGQKLEAPLDLTRPELLELAKSLATVDGALHIGAGVKLHGFACLLDGKAIVSEDRSRGARFNSALRFTAEHDHLMVVVVSSDRPVSIIQEGVELNARCQWNAVAGYMTTPPTLESWLQAAGLTT